MNGWIVAKYALAVAGVALVVSADRVGAHWLSFVGLALIVVAFLLRFVPRLRGPAQAP